MDSFELYKIASNQWNKAMNYHDNIDYTSKKKGQKITSMKSFKEREKQKREYDKAVFYFKLYESLERLEEKELKKKC